MITHSITMYVKAPDPPTTQVDTSHKFNGEFNSEEHRRYVHGRVLKFNRWKIGDHVSVHGDLGVVTDIAVDFDDVEWSGMKCLCVDVFLYSDSEGHLFHPGDLKESYK